MVTCGPILSDGHIATRPLKQQIFDLVRATGPVSRADVAKHMAISPGTVSTLTAELIADGMVREELMPRTPGDTVRGRPPVGLTVCPEAVIVAGIKLSRSERTGMLVDFAGRQLAAGRTDVDDSGSDPEAQIDAIGRMIDDMLTGIGCTRRDLGAVGLGLPGFVHHGTGRVHWCPLLEGRDIDLAAMATARLGVPVTIDNDANLVALAELWFGKGRHTADFAVVTAEEGVGVGTVLGHRLFRGANGLGPELGHIKVQLDGALCRCGQRGCLEAYLADYALAREASAALQLGTEAADFSHRIEALQRAAHAGNAAAQSIFDRAGRYLAAGLATVVNLFDPSLLILSGGRVRYDWLESDRLIEQMRDFTIDTGRGLPPLQVHEWGDLLWAHGAAALALQHVTDARLRASREAVA